jgi:nitrate reductase NapD
MKQAACLAGNADPGDLHIAGILVHCRAEVTDRLAATIDAMPGAEVFQRSPQGKLVVVAEAPAAKDVLDLIDAIRALPDVYNVSLVYQHAEPAASLAELLPPEAGAGMPASQDGPLDASPVKSGAMEQ